jgi:hypothetical protein
MPSRFVAATLTMLLLLVLATPALAVSYYQDKKFPPDPLVAKICNKAFSQADFTFLRIAGKYLDQNGAYRIFVLVKDKQGQEKFFPQPFVFLRLDTNYWVITLGTEKMTLLEN